jgi:uncharacterized protein
MPALTAILAEDLKTAMKSRDAAALNVLRALKTALTNAAIEKGGAGAELDDAEALAVVRKQVKQRADSAAGFRAGGREDLAATEEAEAKLLENYLPQALSEAEVAALVEQAVAATGAAGKAQMGAVMKAVTALAAGRADGRTLSAAVARRLA